MTATVTDQRAYNFSAGPAVLPVSVLEEVRDELLCLPGARCSLLEMSHRDKEFIDILHDAENSIRTLIGINDDYAVLFLQGGAALQFSMIPANLLRDSGKRAAYIQTGAWGQKAIEEASKEGAVDIVYDAKSSNFDHVPAAGDYQVANDAAYLYFCNNETIQGVQFQSEPQCPANVPLICDASSDFLHRQIDINKYGLLYACAQKNAGPAGVTVVIMRRDLVERSRDSLPGYLNYKNHADADSEWNTPPTFAIWVLGKVAKWLKDDIGGLAAMEKINRDKAAILYQAIDQSSGFYKGHAKLNCRSLMNATFTLPSNELESAFLAGAKQHDLVSLKGHRSVGGIRASIYNAMPTAGVQQLADFMTEFASKNA